MSNQVIPIPIQWLTAPEGACNALPAGDLNAWGAFIAEHLFATLSSLITGVTVSSTPPADTTRAWLKVDTDLFAVRLYNFAGGYWVARHPIEPGMTMIWSGGLPDLDTFDGGAAGSVTKISGPMWEIDSVIHTNTVAPFVARYPIAVGQMPTSLTALAVGDTGGEEKHTLTAQESPPHKHDISLSYGPQSGSATQCLLKNPSEGSAVTKTTESAMGDPTTAVPGTTTPTAAAPHNNMPPYVAVYYLRRTSRTHYAETP